LNLRKDVFPDLKALTRAGIGGPLNIKALEDRIMTYWLMLFVVYGKRRMMIDARF